jgi:hypothetical protein
MKRIAQITTVILISLSMTSCFHSFPLTINGSGPIVNQTFDLAPFDEISSETVIDIEVVQGNKQQVTAEGNENMMNYIELKVINNKLYVDLKNGSYNHFELKVYITIPSIKEVELESTGNVYLSEFTKLESLNLYSNSTGNIDCDGIFEIKNDLNIRSSSTGNVSIKMNCNELDVEANSTGNVTIKGTCNTQHVNLDGTGNYNAFDLNSKECTVTTNGTGDARVNVSEQLYAKIRSVGSIYYKGDPKVNVQDSSIGSLIWTD